MRGQFARELVVLQRIELALQAFVQHIGRQPPLGVAQQGLQQADQLRGMVGGEQLPQRLFAQLAIAGDPDMRLHAGTDRHRIGKTQAPAR